MTQDPTEDLLQALRDALGDEAVSTDIEARYRKDYFSSEPEDVTPLAVVRPAMRPRSLPR